MKFYVQAVDAIYNNRPDARELPLPLLKDIAALNSGAGHTFAFGEFKANDGTVIRIDDFLGRVARSLVMDLESGKDAQVSRFAGAAFAYFDGEIKVVDLLNDTHRAILTLTAGGKQIECIINALSDDELRVALNRRVMAYGRALYDGLSDLPRRFELTRAEPLGPPTEHDLAVWQGSFHIAEAEASVEVFEQ